MKLKLTPLSKQEVIKLKDNFRKKVDNILNDITDDKTDLSIKKSIRKNIISMYINRAINISDLSEYFNLKSLSNIDNVTKNNVASPFSKKQRKQILNAAKSRFTNLERGLMGTSERRLYFELSPEQDISASEIKITKYLENIGYKVVDYKKNWATDDIGKQRYKIGKLLKKNRDLADEFKQDKTKEVKIGEIDPNDHLVVLSDRPNDIAYMSTRRRWTSCMEPDHRLFSQMPHDISKGSLVAYLIKKDDPNIYDPVSRILLKPFENENGDCIYEFGKVYETYSPLFINKVAEIAKSISSDKNGLFTMRSDIYGDGLERTKSINLESIKNAEESNLNKPEKRIRNFISSMMR